MTDIRVSQAAIIAAADAEPNIRVTQVAPIAITYGGIAPNIRASQVAIISVSYEPDFAANIRASAAAIVMPSLDSSGGAATINVTQTAIVICAQELPWVPIIPPISLPKYIFSAVPFYVKR